MTKSCFATLLLAANLGMATIAFAASTKPPADTAAPADAAITAKKPAKKLVVKCAKDFTLVKGKCVAADPKPAEDAAAPADTVAPVKPAADKKSTAKKKLTAKSTDAEPPAEPVADKPMQVTCAEGYTFVKKKCVEATTPPEPMEKPKAVTTKAKAKAEDVATPAKDAAVKKTMTKKPDAKKPTVKAPVTVTCAKGLVLQNGKCIAAEAAVQ